MEIVFLETISLGDDINLDRFDELGHVTKYRDTPVELVPERVKDADVVVINKIPMNEKTLAGASHLKLVAVTATGMDNIDRAYTDSHGILSANVAGYSTEAVAQHTFALMFYVLHKLAYYDHYVKSGAYCTSAQFSHFEQNFQSLTERPGVLSAWERSENVWHPMHRNLAATLFIIQHPGKIRISRMRA